MLVDLCLARGNVAGAVHITKMCRVYGVLGHLLVARADLPAPAFVVGPRRIAVLGHFRQLPLRSTAARVVPDHDQARDLLYEPAAQLGLGRDLLGVGNIGAAARASELPGVEGAT